MGLNLNLLALEAPTCTSAEGIAFVRFVPGLLAFQTLGYFYLPFHVVALTEVAIAG